MAKRRLHDRETIPVVEERAVTLKRKKVTGAVRVRTVVHEDEEVIDEPLRTEGRRREDRRAQVAQGAVGAAPIRRPAVIDTALFQL